MVDGVELTALPIKQVSYAPEWSFHFKDKDGFLLVEQKKLDGEWLSSGKTNVFQGKLQDKIPYNIAIKVYRVELYPSLVKCITCKPPQR